MYGFALRPRWVVAHAIVVLAVAFMIWAALWQWGRLGERRDTNAQISARSQMARVDVAQAITDAGADGSDLKALGEELRYRPVAAVGTYVTQDEVLVRNRSLNGAPGYWVLTPLMLDAAPGSAVLVNRGWVPLRLEPGEPRPEAAAPGGEVEVSGVVQPTSTREGLGVADPADGRLDSLARVDIARVDQQVDYELLGVYIQLETQMPPQDTDLPALIELPPLDGGPHLGYAAQWAIFATIASVGYVLILRRTARGKQGVEPL